MTGRIEGPECGASRLDVDRLQWETNVSRNNFIAAAAGVSSLAVGEIKLTATASAAVPRPVRATCLQ